MQIGEVIRKYRIAKDMTQEEMAERLGVTAPAVNKWENGKTLPDISLLAPIARLLGTTPDTLLSFHETLTEEEVALLVKELNARLKRDTFEECFEWGKEMIQQHPNCEVLICQIAIVLNAHLLFKIVSETEKYESCFYKWYSAVLESADENVRRYAADSLFGYHMRKDEYEKAEEYLKYFSAQDPERKRKQAQIYHKSGRIEEAYKTYEELLFSCYQMCSIVFPSLSDVAMQEKNIENARYYLDKQEELAKLFEMGMYHEVCGKLKLAEAEGDESAAQEIAEQLMECADSLTAFRNARLYAHMEFREEEPELLEDIKKDIFTNFSA